MFGNLVESRRKKQRSVNGIAASVLAHGAVIVAAGYASGTVTPPPAAIELPHRDLTYITPPKAPAQSAPTRSGGTAGRGSSGPVLPLPPKRVDNIGIPPISEQVVINLDNLVAGPGTFERSDGRGGGEGIGSAEGGDGYAERPAVPNANNPKPDYPSMLRAAGIEGRVNARFTVDTSGRVEPGSIVLETQSNELFAAAVRKALERSRFTPAEAGGRKVRIRMSQEFAFRIWR